jgi:glycosyltransferase involved in cell wall biosynthesis
MKCLLIDSWIHKKNKHGFKLMCDSVGATLLISTQLNSESANDEWDIILSPSEYINPAYFPNAKKIIFGPHAFIHLKAPWTESQCFDSRCVYNLLSNWVVEFVKEQGNLGIETCTLPFAVDVERFKRDEPLEYKYDCFIYEKHRDIKIFQEVTNYVKSLGLKYKVFNTHKKYDEEEYLEVLKNVRFGIWLDSHESQGFALQEALSCNVPLVVLDAKSVFDERNEKGEVAYAAEQGKYKWLATTCPYWHECCGFKDQSLDVLKTNIVRMTKEYSRFKPREFVLEFLSPKVCMNRFLNI